MYTHFAQTPNVLDLAQSCLVFLTEDAVSNQTGCRLKTTEGMKGTRINFAREVSTPQETRQALVEMVRQAKTSPVGRDHL